MSAPSQKPNRLLHEKSPYLLQHAHNPVNWYPWGEEALAKAKNEDKPIFLSVGYSTCHWCHVMEHESFSDVKVAELMNREFVSIKVDREERPDLDQIYMSAVMTMTSQGGWPMSVFLTPEGKPFYGGTYYPPQPAWGRPSFTQILEHVANLWKNRREEVLRAAEQLTSAVAESSLTIEKGELSDAVLEGSFASLQNTFDSAKGGFEVAPKFPRAHTLSFLLRYYKRSGDRTALMMVTKTLDEMAKGGIYDHLGGGFHRYATDQYWHVPHFEKMLYDQAINAKAYLEAYQITQNENYARVVRETLDYVLRDMTSPEGGFYSAEDADSALTHDDPKHKVEGTFFVFELNELEKILGKEKAVVAADAFGVEASGNAGTGAHGELKNKNVLFLAHSDEAIAKKFKKSDEEVQKWMAEIKQKLFAYREKRPRPHLDDKILTDWNGLMISTFAFAGRVLKEPKYVAAAQKGADFILAQLRREDGGLLHRYRKGEAGISGYLEDYSFFIHGLIDLYQATFDISYLIAANELTQKMVASFWDNDRGGFYHTAGDAEKLIARTKEIYDGAIPSGNSVALLDLLRISRLTLNRDLEQKAEEAFKTFAPKINSFPSGYPQMLIAYAFGLGPSQEIVIAPGKEKKQTDSMIDLFYENFLPNAMLAIRPTNPKAEKSFVELIPFAADQTAQGNQTTAYVCQNYVCNLPTTDLKQLKKLLEK